jgi:diacylglycerol kinase family enzyme
MAKKASRNSCPAVVVNEYQTLKLFELGHRDKLDAGVLQVTAITELNDQTIRQLMTTLTLTKFFSDKTPDNFQQWTTTSFTVNSKQSKLIVGVDGEREAYAAPVKVTIRHKALRVIVPPEGIRDRRHSPIGRRVITKLLEAVSGRVR